VVPTNQSLEAITLRNFINTLKQEQAEALLGKWENGTCVARGVLTEEQISALGSGHRRVGHPERAFGEREAVAERFDLPVYLYARAAQRPAVQTPLKGTDMPAQRKTTTRKGSRRLKTHSKNSLVFILPLRPWCKA
jgi:hypothetical protein